MTTQPQASPDISVCIANYNGDPYVLNCLASVYAQQGDFELEVLLHDDCSTDISLSLVRHKFPDTVVLTSSENVGFCISNNRMAAVAKGRYLLLLNNDAVLRPGSLQHLLKYAKMSNSDCVLGLPQYTLPDKVLVDRGYRTDFFLNPIPILTPGIHEAGVATGACLWIPRLVWNEVEGFPDWFESVAEDIFLCLAVRLLGYDVIVLDMPGFDHCIGRNLGGGKIVAERLETTVRRRAMSERNKTFVLLLCYPKLVLLIVMPLHALFLTVEAFFLVISGLGYDKVRRIYAPLPAALWRNRKKIADLRTHLMRKRQCSSTRFFEQTSWIPQKLRLLLRHGPPRLH